MWADASAAIYSHQKKAQSNVSALGRVSMSSLQRVWEPKSQGSFLPEMAVPFKGLVMTVEQYRPLLEDRLRYLVDQDPAEARELLTASPEHNPSLYQVGMSNPHRDYPVQIMMCDQMLIRLARIDWPLGRIQMLPKSQLPDLRALVEAI
jgi:hypothetical protein